MNRTILEADRWHRAACEAQRNLFRAICEVDTKELWWAEGAHSTAHWLGMQYGISYWKALRWIDAARALERLPALSEAFSCGVLGVDKVVELCRFAQPETETQLIRWAQNTPCGAIRERGDDLLRRTATDVRSAHEDRYVVGRRVDEGNSFLMSAKMPVVEGVAVFKSLTRKAEQLPVIPGQETTLIQRRADALVAMASASIAKDTDPDRATVVIHAQVDGSNARIENGPALSEETTRRLMCDARVQTVLEDAEGNAFKLGRMAREPSSAMIRQLRHRDTGCRFPGCGFRAFTQAHHIVHWKDGGPTDLENLIIICTFHHKAVHELGWKVAREHDGTLRWRRPDGREHRAGPAPPRDEPIAV